MNFRTEITPGNPARVYFSWNSLGYLGGLALMTARLISDSWSRVKVTKLCIPEEGRLHNEMTTLSAYLAQRYVAGGSGRHNPEDADDREDENEAAARFFQEGWFGCYVSLREGNPFTSSTSRTSQLVPTQVSIGTINFQIPVQTAQLLQRKGFLLNSLEHSNSGAQFAVYTHIIHHSWLHFNTMILVKVPVRIICFHHDDSSHKISFPYISPWNLAVCLNFQRPLAVARAENEHITPLGKGKSVTFKHALGWGSLNSQQAQFGGRSHQLVSVDNFTSKPPLPFWAFISAQGQPIYFWAIDIGVISQKSAQGPILLQGTPPNPSTSINQSSHPEVAATSTKLQDANTVCVEHRRGRSRRRFGEAWECDGVTGLVQALTYVVGKSVTEYGQHPGRLTAGIENTPLEKKNPLPTKPSFSGSPTPEMSWVEGKFSWVKFWGFNGRAETFRKIQPIWSCHFFGWKKW